METATRAVPTTQVGNLRFALFELGQVLWTWVTGEGDLIGLLAAWAEIVTGKVVTE